MIQFSNIYEPDSIRFPVPSSEADVLAIAKETSFEHVFSFFREYLLHNPEFDLVLSPKFGLFLIQNTALPEYTPDLDAYLIRTGYELCYYILEDLALTTYYELFENRDIGECSEEEENAVRERIKSFTDQFPYTSKVVLNKLFNH
jgi:hypothetical protein